MKNHKKIFVLRYVSSIVLGLLISIVLDISSISKIILIIIAVVIFNICLEGIVGKTKK